jgi:hypothetical protein
MVALLPSLSFALGGRIRGWEWPVDSVQKPGEMAVDSVDSLDSSSEVHDLMMI